jgi:hypothetical protein
VTDLPDKDIQKNTIPVVDSASLLALWSTWLNADLSEIMTDTGAFKPINTWPKHFLQMIDSVDVKEVYERSRDGGEASWDKVGQVIRLKKISARDLSELIARHKAVDAFVAQKEQQVNIAVVSAERARQVSNAVGRLDKFLASSLAPQEGQLLEAEVVKPDGEEKAGQ